MKDRIKYLMVSLPIALLFLVSFLLRRSASDANLLISISIILPVIAYAVGLFVDLIKKSNRNLDSTTTPKNKISPMRVTFSIVLIVLGFMSFMTIFITGFLGIATGVILIFVGGKRLLG